GYLASIGSDPRAVQQRRPPGLGAGGPPPAGTDAASKDAPGADQSKSSQAAVATLKPRRPSDSIEAGRLPEAGAAEAVSPPPASSGWRTTPAPAAGSRPPREQWAPPQEQRGCPAISPSSSFPAFLPPPPSLHRPPRPRARRKPRAPAALRPPPARKRPPRQR